MQKFMIAHYGEKDSPWLVNGGKLLINDERYIARCFMKTVAEFSASDTEILRLEDEPLFDGILLQDQKKRYRVYFHKRTARRVYAYFRI